MRNLKSVVQEKIKEKGYTQELVSQQIGMSRMGFIKAVDNESMKLKEFSKLIQLLSIDPVDFFESRDSTGYKIAAEPGLKYKKVDTVILIQNESDLINFQARQIERLTEAVRNLSGLLGQSDTVSNKY